MSDPLLGQLITVASKVGGECNVSFSSLSGNNPQSPIILKTDNCLSLLSLLCCVVVKNGVL